LSGSNGGDMLWGDDGNDVIYGGDGIDTISGGNGRDTLWGGTGNDLIQGGGGDDLLRGEAGLDVFIFAPGAGSDRIIGFTPGEDLIRLDIAGLDYAGLNLRTSGADMLIDIGTGTLTFADLAPGQLSVDDFQFL
jgi:Ca2+-binding RTX toxin-like protein